MTTLTFPMADGHIFETRIDGFHRRYSDEWGRPGKRTANAKAHARAHGCAGVVLPSDAFRLYYVEDGSLRQKTWRPAYHH